jgi:hypothetical protein
MRIAILEVDLDIPKGKEGKNWEKGEKGVRVILYSQFVANIDLMCLGVDKN